MLSNRVLGRRCPSMYVLKPCMSQHLLSSDHANRYTSQGCSDPV